MRARNVLCVLQNHLSVLFPPSEGGCTQIWIPRPPTFNQVDKAVVWRWRQYLKWEESNPLEMEEKDQSLFHTRMQLLYRQAVVKMRFSPEIWYMAYSWTMSIGKQDEAIAILKQGMQANPVSYVVLAW